MILSLIFVMKTKTHTQKELASRIFEKITEALEGIDTKAVKKIKRSAENTSVKLAKKLTTTVSKLAKKEESAARKGGKKAKTKENKPKAIQATKAAEKKESTPGKPATSKGAPAIPSGEKNQGL